MSFLWCLIQSIVSVRSFTISFALESTLIFWYLLFYLVRLAVSWIIQLQNVNCLQWFVAPWFLGKEPIGCW